MNPMPSVKQRLYFQVQVQGGFSDMGGFPDDDWPERVQVSGMQSKRQDGGIVDEQKNKSENLTF